MTTAGPNYPQTWSSASNLGGVTSFGSTGNAISSNNSYTTASWSASNGTFKTNYLKGVAPAFAIPPGATINSITADVERKASHNDATRYVRDEQVKLIKGGTIGGTNKADTTTKWPTSDGTASYGGDLWGQTWTAEDINSATFGIAISANLTAVTGATTTASIDGVTITVDYTEAAAGGQPMQARATLVLGMRQWQPGRR
jgi:hypothetical protein